MRSEGRRSVLSAGYTDVWDWSMLSGTELEYAADCTPGSCWMASNACRWKTRPCSSEYPARFNSNAAVEMCCGTKPRLIFKACWRPRKERKEAETSTKHSATCTMTSTSRSAKRLRPHMVESPRSAEFGSVLEARQAGAVPKSPAATIEPAKANRKTRQSRVTLNCTGKSMGACQRLRAVEMNEASR